MRAIPFYLLYGGLFLLYIINIFIGSSAIHLVISWVGVILFLLSWPLASNLFKLISILFTVMGVSMSLYAGVPLGELPEQLPANMPMLIFLSMLPWMASAFSVGKYDEALKNMIDTNDGRLSGMYGKTMSTTYSLLVFINISAIYIVQHILLEKMKGIQQAAKHDFIIKATLRTFSIAAIWSPMEIILGITIEETGVSFLSYLPWLLLCSLLLAVMEAWISRRHFTEIEIMDTKLVDKKELLVTLAKLFIVLLTFFLAIISLNQLTELTFIFTVAMTIFPFTFLWSLFMRRPLEFLKAGWKNWKSYNNGLQNFFVLFLSLALFSQGFNQTNIPAALQQVLGAISDYTLFIFIFITVIYFALGLIGVHPVATIAILLEMLRPLFDIINPLSIGIVLVVSAMATTASAPYGINTTLTVQTIHVSPYYVTKLNAPFSILMSAVGIIIAMIVL